MKRILILGSVGAGKSTLAIQLGNCLPQDCTNGSTRNSFGRFDLPVNPEA